MSYENVLARFEQAYDEAGGPVVDDDYMRDAITVLWTELLSGESPVTPLEKAAMAVLMRLLSPPDMEKERRVSFPSVPYGEDEGPFPTKRDRVRFQIARRVHQLVREGHPVTHAFAAVAADIHKSTEKVAKDYYELRADVERYEAGLVALRAKRGPGLKVV